MPAIETPPPRYGLTTSVAATVAPISTTDMKLHLRVDHADEDALIDSFVLAARDYVERTYARTLVDTTYQMTLADFPKTILLPRSPVSAVSSITYEDADGATQTLATSVYQTDLVSEPARIVEAWGQTWPVSRAEMNAITVTFVGGYGSAASDVPDGILTAMKMMIENWYRNRSSTISGTIIAEVPMAVNMLLADFQVWYR